VISPIVIRHGLASESAALCRSRRPPLPQTCVSSKWAQISGPDACLSQQFRHLTQPQRVGRLSSRDGVGLQKTEGSPRLGVMVSESWDGIVSAHAPATGALPSSGVGPQAGRFERGKRSTTSSESAGANCPAKCTTAKVRNTAHRSARFPLRSPCAISAAYGFCFYPCRASFRAFARMKA
jgi:hypothetical protein